MSFKAKNLSYEANEPSFLRRLRAGVSSGDTDRHERPVARPKRSKKDADDDDGPTYVMEENGESLSKAEYEALQKGEEQGAEKAEPSKDSDEVEAAGDTDITSTKPKQSITEAGQAQRKRKAGKVIGEMKSVEQPNERTVSKTTEKVTKKPAKKAKAVKLSFDDD